jgi:hypothetical protein
MRVTLWTLVIGAALAAASPAQQAGKSPTALFDEIDDVGSDGNEYTDLFLVRRSELSTTGRNPYMILEPGYTLFLEGRDPEDGAHVRLVIRVTHQTRLVGGFNTRVVEEKEYKDGELFEVARNYFAISTKSNSVFYFGEDVDFYENGRIVGHEGTWHHGRNGARFGLQMPGIALVGARYYQELAPGVALDRAEITDVDEDRKVPAGHFRNVLETLETTPLDPESTGLKFYAPGVGLIQDSFLKLTRYGFE